MTAIVHVGFDAKDFSAKSGKLFIADPARQEGLVSTVTKGTKPVTYLNSYHVEDQVHCAFCATHQRHNMGFTVGLADGSMALCGRNCAEGFFGTATARALRADLERRQDREKQRETIARTFAGIADAQDHFSDVLAAQEQAGLELIKELALILPEHAQTKIRAGDVAGVNGRFLTLFQTSPIVPRIQGVLRHMAGVMARDCEMSEVVLKKSMDSRARLLRWIGELSDFFAEMERFLSAENLWHLVQYHESLPHDGAVIGFKSSKAGAALHVFLPGNGMKRYTVGQTAFFDGGQLLRLLTSGAAHG